MSKLTEEIWRLAEPIVEKAGCELWDVEYVREAGTWHLRVYIDKEPGVSINDCENVSRELDPILDEADPIPGSYVFEVSSAGAERELKRPKDFPRFYGHAVEVKLYKALDGSKTYIGQLVSYDDGDITVEVSGKEIKFEKSQIAHVRLRIV